MSMLFGMFGLGHYELLILLAILLVLFGHRLPSLMRNLGRGVNEFKAGLHTQANGDEVSQANDEEENA